MKEVDTAIGELKRHLDDHGTADAGEVAKSLAAAWPSLRTDGNEAKLWRLEQPQWDSPVLRFTIERHGAIVAGGSTRAELEH